MINLVSEDGINWEQYIVCKEYSFQQYMVAQNSLYAVILVKDELDKIKVNSLISITGKVKDILKVINLKDIHPFKTVVLQTTKYNT